MRATRVLTFMFMLGAPVGAIESRAVDGSVADRKAIQDIASRWQDAWNRHDMDALSSLVAEDVDFVNVGARWMRNRQEFKDHHAERHQIVFKESVWTTKNVHLKFIRSDVAVVHVEWSIRGDRNADGTPREPREGLFTWVVEKQNGRWLIVAAQNTNVAPPSSR